jgi:hypothetical protein
MSPGRNDLCPCGSGLKYKKCCLLKDEAAHSIGARSADAARLSAIAKLLRFADSPEFEDAHTAAYELFWPDTLDDLDEDEALDFLGSVDVQAKFHPWLLFDFEVEPGRTFSDLFLERRDWGLDPREHDYIGRLRQSWMSLYQVEDVERGHGLLVRDLLTRQRTFVHERMASEEAVRWDLLAARLLPEENGTMRFEGGIYFFDITDRSELLNALKQWQRKGRKIGASDASIRKQNGIVFNHLWLELVVFRPVPEILDDDDEPPPFATSVFGVSGDAALPAAFAGPDRDAEMFAPEDLPADPRAEINKEAFRPRDLLRLKQKLMDDYYRKWLDQSSPALNGATPREAAASRKLRPLLVNVLRELENRSESARLRNPDAYDPGWLWDELGVGRKPPAA